MAHKLLVVDDEVATVDMIATFMEIVGYDMVSAHDGISALTMLELEQPDMLILDLMMPDMKGFEICRRIRQQEHYTDLPILIVSARTDDEAIAEAYDAGANGYMTKPFDLNKLLGEIKRFLPDG
ncbi:MAG: response regulator transcription factor [Anaerolineales bacterium]